MILALAWQLLRELGFHSRPAAISVLVLLSGSTLPWHFQNNQENTLMLALACLALIGLLRWERTGSAAWLHVACAAQAWNVLIRLPNLALVLPLFAVPFLFRWLAPGPTPFWKQSLRPALQVAVASLPWFALAAALDRIWHHARFGTWSGTYMDELSRWVRQIDPGLPTDFPFSGHFLDGLLGFLVSPGKSLFLYEPLTLIILLVFLLARRQLPPAASALILAATWSLIGFILGLSRMVFWSGEPSWGPRFLATSAHLLQLPLGAWFVMSPFAARARTGAIAGLALLAVLQCGGLWFPAYHESLISGSPQRLQSGTKEPSPVQRLHLVPGPQADWRLVKRPIEAFRDLALQVRDPAAWRTSKAPLRMLPPTRPLDSLSAPIRWALRSAWCLGFVTCLAFARRSLRHSEVST